jgi:hypothetical protein
MDTSQVTDRERTQTEAPRPKSELTLQDDAVMAWEPVGGDMWLPRRIRGSWRGGVLG